MDDAITYRGCVYPLALRPGRPHERVWYVGKFDEATWTLFLRAGIEETGEVAALTTLLGLHLDTHTRKSCAFPPEILERARMLCRGPAVPG